MRGGRACTLDRGLCKSGAQVERTVIGDGTKGRGTGGSQKGKKKNLHTRCRIGQDVGELLLMLLNPK